MAKANMGVKMIEMYCNMIQERFGPIIQQLESRITPDIRDQIDIEVKKKLGVYDLYMKKKTIELQLQEINNQLARYEGGRVNGTYYNSIINKEINAVIAEINKPALEARLEMQLLIDKVKMAGISEEIREVFNEVATRLDGLGKKYAELPPIKVKPMKKLKEVQFERES